MRVPLVLLNAILMVSFLSSVKAFVPSQVGVSSRTGSHNQIHRMRSLNLLDTKSNSSSSRLSKLSADKGSNIVTDASGASAFSYGSFAKENPLANSVLIASFKTAAADLLAQVVISQTPLMEVDLERTFLFFTFGALYSGGFQYLYQVNVFKKIFDVEKFTNQSWGEKVKDKQGLKDLAAQTTLDLIVLATCYLPAFYIFKAGLFSGSADPSVWASTGIENYTANFSKDEYDALRVWFPADLVCFSVPLYQRLPVRHVVSFLWTIYLSFARGGH